MQLLLILSGNSQKVTWSLPHKGEIVSSSPESKKVKVSWRSSMFSRRELSEKQTKR